MTTPDATLDRYAEVQRMTQEVFDVFDRVVRENPEQCFWFNKRWILEPFDEATPAHGSQDDAE